MTTGMNLWDANVWGFVITMTLLFVSMIIANILRNTIPALRKLMIPSSVLGGFILLIVNTIFKNCFHIELYQTSLLEVLTYHGLGLGFAAMALRNVDKKQDNRSKTGAFDSGVTVVSTYLLQAVLGLVVTVILFYAINSFFASGILLPMGYGQGPGQANNVGSSYEALGMAGGQSFGLSLAAMGYLCACSIGVIFLNVLNRKNKKARIKNKDELSGSVTLELFQDNDEIPISESIDKLSVQAAIIALLYLFTFLLTAGIVALLEKFAPGLAKTLSPLLWGFNFIVGSIVAMACRSFFGGLKRAKIMKHQYLNNYLLNRLSGLAFDIMIVAGIASIDIKEMSNNWLPFVLMAVVGGVVTHFYLMFMCKRLYPDYFYEGYFSMFGMLTGTLSSGILLLREVDPDLKTPASNNMITGSSFGIIFGAPMLLLISYAAQSEASVWISLGILFVYLAALLLFIAKAGKKKK